MPSFIHLTEVEITELCHAVLVCDLANVGFSMRGVLCTKNGLYLGGD